MRPSINFLFLALSLVHVQGGHYNHTTLRHASGTPQAQGGSYKIDSVIDQGTVAVGGVASVAQGYVGQLVDPVHLELAPEHTIIDENAINHVSSLAFMDDGSLTLLEGDEIKWQIAAGPIITTETAGTFLALPVYQAEFAIISGMWQAFQTETSFTVNDSEPDNIPPVDGDGIHDSWQFHYFDADANGILDASEAVAANPQADSDADGHVNHFEWLIKEYPKDPSSDFEFKMLEVENDAVIFSLSTAHPNILYEIVARTDLHDQDGDVVSAFTVASQTKNYTTAVAWPTDLRGFFHIRLSADH